MNIHDILKRYWGYENFRPLQEDIIRSILDGKDTLAILPTGGGKSICYQVPALTNDGICIVISPLIALMKDQVENLHNKTIPAASIVSGMSYREIDITLDNCIYGKIKFLYLSPERLLTNILRARIIKMKVNLLAVDEAHCISQWGYDFRPPYLQIAEIRELLPRVPVLALTATATVSVKKDIQEKLLFKSSNIIQGNFARQNLSYVVLYEENKLEKLLKIINNVNGSGIVYVKNRRTAKNIADFLTKKKISADYYHAGLDMQTRSLKQDSWKKNKTRVIVSTNAFGMGIDKPDVRFVVHINLPDSIEAYYQEAGRAGRDNNKSYAVMLYNKTDKLDFEHRYSISFPTIDEVKRTYQALSNYYKIPIGAVEGKSFDFDITDFCEKFNLNILTAFNSIKYLEKQGIIAVTEAFYMPSRLMFIVDNLQLYKFQVAVPKYDAFIKLVLRSYEGVFSDFVKINETDIAKRMDTNIADVINSLKYLDKCNIISYEAQKNTPQIMFLQERIDVKNLNVDKALLESRKKIYYEKMTAILNYAGKNNKCRSQLLLAYFGEYNSKTCGICDVCLGRNKLYLGELEFENICNQIQEKLTHQHLALDILVQKLNGVNEDKVLKTIQWLLDNGTLKTNTENIIMLSE